MAEAALNRDALLQEVAAAGSPEALEQVRVRLLGRNGAVTAAMRGLGGVDCPGLAPGGWRHANCGILRGHGPGD